MNNNKDPMERIIEDDLLKEAASIDAEIEKAGVEEMPADLKEKIREKLHKQIEKQERERVYAQLSEEDRQALELGREMLKKSASSDKDGIVVYRRKRRKVFVAVAAVAVLVLAMGITSIGGPERVIEMIETMVGDREGVQVNTGEDNYIVKIDKEENAYQEIKDTFGVEAIKLIHWPGEVEFVYSEIDAELQTALLRYEYSNKLIDYYISSNFMIGSWGVDVENEKTDTYYIELEQIKVEVQEYEKPETKEKMYSAKYSYSGLDYFLIGAMERSDFDFLIKNLKIF